MLPMFTHLPPSPIIPLSLRPVIGSGIQKPSFLASKKDMLSGIIYAQSSPWDQAKAGTSMNSHPSLASFLFLSFYSLNGVSWEPFFNKSSIFKNIKSINESRNLSKVLLRSFDIIILL